MCGQNQESVVDTVLSYDKVEGAREGQIFSPVNRLTKMKWKKVLLNEEIIRQADTIRTKQWLQRIGTLTLQFTVTYLTKISLTTRIF